MSNKKNYRAMYNNQKRVAEETVPTPLKDEESVDTTIDDTIDTTIDDTAETPVEEGCKFVIGTVSGCARLNVREEPDVYAEVICTIPVYSEVQVCQDHEFNDWFHVCTAAGQEGYCMKQFITIQ